MAGADSRDRTGGGPLLQRLGPPVAVFAVTRVLVLLCVFRLIVLPGVDPASDVTVLYHSWFEVMRGGTFPLHDVTWQYPPAAALPMLAPALLPFLDYTSAFIWLACAADVVGFGLLLRAGRDGAQGSRGMAGAWVWVLGAAMIGPTVYARYDLQVTVVAMAALLAAARHPRVSGALAGFGAMLKVWPVLLLVGTPPGRAGRRMWAAAGIAVAAIALFFTTIMPGGFAFLTFQSDRGTEIESLGSLVFHLARRFGHWHGGKVLLNYGSVEFLGPYVSVVSHLALALTAIAFGWLLLWRLKARTHTPATMCDAAFTAILLFTTTSRVISPQYMIWLVGLAAVCMTLRASVQAFPAVLVLVATAVTGAEFPVLFHNVVTSSSMGVAVLMLRNGLLVAASLIACRNLWRASVSRAPHMPDAPQAAPVPPLRRRPSAEAPHR
jgi:hypothetical protein